MGPLVTVFMTAYNSETYIKDALNSIIHQTYKNLEIIIIDDHSTDKTNEFIRSYNDKRVRLITNEVNRGIAYNRHQGILLANGKYLAIMDADDISDIHRIEIQVEFMEKHKDITALGTAFKYFGKKINNRVMRNKLNVEQMKIALIFENPILNSSSIIRLEEIRKFNINYDVNYFVAQDYKIWADISKVGRIENIAAVLLKYRFGHNNITRKSLAEKSRKRSKLVERIRNNLLDFYRFNFNIVEKKTFNLFFAEFNPVLDDKLVFNIKRIIIKMKSNNKYFKNTLLDDQIEKSVERVMMISKLSIHKRYFFWRYLSMKPKIYILLKSVYYYFRYYLKKMIVG